MLLPCYRESSRKFHIIKIFFHCAMNEPEPEPEQALSQFVIIKILQAARQKGLSELVKC